ncbi:UDP-N-acetylglucosamine 2-epimerase [Desulfoluna spongiiphila]|uniref:UDP-N-acetylglucosamine 2-epimerase n=1 Tax=Desulfoluna spongiiphila TaxID=419481 RepID=UPI0012591036|nr:UDP-N-acetylglucosamine 2-epimerase [Desulfoluna spongiiphila]VVS90855.1 udp-n-acetylglucosamine 2-epimerase domain [Desulfoluna spongiiphila]
MIHFFIGTKAQFIKVAPVIEEVVNRGVEYNLIDTKQHSKTTAELIGLFNLRPPDVVLSSRKDNIDKVRDAIFWILKDIIRLIFCSKKVFQKVFRGKNGVCVVHGDTLTTLLSILYAKRCGLKILHIESGLRSYDLFNPFPEEIIRLLSMKMSDYLIAPSYQAYQNLCGMGYRSKSVHIEGNTGKDAALKIVQMVSGGLESKCTQRENYIVVTIHRAENIYNHHRMKFLCDAVKSVSVSKHVVFVFHGPTSIQLKKYGFFGSLSRDQNISCIGLQPYDKFIKLILAADCVLTDGGSIQEECSYFNIPCIILRSSTERDDGIGKNAILANFDTEIIKKQLIKIANSHFERPQPHQLMKGPSKKIFEFINQVSNI